MSTHAVPTHPGEMLLRAFLEPTELTQRELADAIAIPYERISEIVDGRRGVTPSTALRLAMYFGTTTEFWTDLQMQWDLYHAPGADADGGKRRPRYRSTKRDRVGG